MSHQPNPHLHHLMFRHFNRVEDQPEYQVIYRPTNLHPSLHLIHQFIQHYNLNVYPVYNLLNNLKIDRQKNHLFNHKYLQVEIHHISHLNVLHFNLFDTLLDNRIGYHQDSHHYSLHANLPSNQGKIQPAIQQNSRQGNRHFNHRVSHRFNH